MRTFVAIGVILAIGAALVFLLLPRGEERPAVDDGGGSQIAPAAPVALDPNPGTPAHPPTGGRKAGASAAMSDESVIRDRGSIRVTLAVAPDGPDVKDARLDIDSLGSGLVAYPLAHRQPDGTRLYESLPVGRYRVRAT